MASSSYAINFNGLLTEQGEQQVFTFDGVIGDRIVFDGIDADPVFENISYSLIDPSGATIFTNFGHTADTAPATLTLSGTYQIVIRGDASTTGDYNFSLLKLNQAPILPLGATVTDALTPGIRSNVYRLNGTKGQRLQFDSLLAPPTSTTWVLYGPGNQALNSSGTSSGTDFSVTLPADGEYYLVFDGTNATASVSYSFQVNDISDPPPASPTAFPFSQSGSVSGSPVDFTFTAAAGTLLYIDSLDPDFDSVSLQILDQGNGNASIYSANATSDSSAGLILPRSGSYTVRVNGSGDYNFRILDLSANATALTLGSTVTETVTPTAGARIFSFSGAVGQQLFYDALDSDFDSVQTFLIGPSGTSLTNLFFVNASSDSDVFTLSESGTYYLVQHSTAQTATDFSFRLLQPPATDLAFDTVTSSTLVPLGTELYRFTGTAGQRLVFDSQSPSASSASVLLRGPNGEAITSGNLASDLEITLTRTGSHILYIDSTSASSIPYSFQLVTPTTTSTPLTLGSAVSGSISELGEQDLYTFTGTAGQRLLFDATVSNARTLFATLRSPSGALVINFADTDFDSNLVTLTETGTYQLSIEGQVGSATSTGNYNFQLIDASAAQSLPLDTDTPGTLTPGAESEFYRFTAAAGQRFAFDNISGTGPTVRVFDAGNTQIGNGSLGFDFEFTTPEAGTYLLQIDGNGFATSPVSYSFRLVTPTTTSTVLSLGSVVSGSIGELGEQDIYTFAGTAGQRLLFDATVNNARVLFATLRSPSGALVINSADTDFDSGLVTLTETGTYQLLVEGLVGNPNSTGSYDFQLIDAAAAPVLTLDTETAGTLTPGAKSEFYRFTAAAGQRFAFDAITGSGPNFRVFDAGNTQIFSGTINFDYEFTTPEAGTYLLQIEGNSNTTTPVSYSFQLVTPTTTSTPLTLGSVVSGSITELGEQDIYTFSGTAGQRLFFDATVNNTRSILATLRSPSGTSLSFLDADSDGTLITLTEPGTYQLIVEGQVGVANSTGDYDFKLIDASNAPLITLGTAIAGTLSPGRESDFYRISGTAGQRLTFDSLAAATGANWRLFDPSNVTVAGASVGAGTDFTAFLDATGTYLLQIDGSSASDVSYNFNVTGTIDPPPAAPTAFPFSQSGTVAGSPVDFTITAAAGKLLYVDSLDPDFDGVSLQILDQGNANTSIYTANAGSDSGGGFALPRSGSYTVRINGTGDFNFRILDLSANATPLTLGTASSGPLAAAATQIFSFSGSAGQRLYFDALEEDNDSLNLSVLRPDGTSVLGGSGEADSFPTFSLTESGAYHLLLINNATTAADFNFVLRDVAAATALPFDTVTNGSLSPGQETDLFRFTGTAGQRLVFDSQTAGFPNATWRVIGPANQSVANQNISTDLELNLTADGTYVLAIDGSSTTTVNYGFSLITPSTTTTALSLNSPVSSSLSEMGERDIYTFTGTAGQRLYYDALTSDFTRSFPVRLIDPTGDIGLLNQQHYFDSNTPFTLTETGTYQLQLESTSSFSLDTGAYSFQLLDLAAATALPFDTVTNGTLSPGQDTDLYSFTGTAGQRLVFDSQTPGFPSVSWRLFGPGNQSLANQNITSDLDLTLSADGTYVLAIDGASATNVNYSFSLVTPTTSTTALSLNSPVSSSLAEIGERDIYTFTGSVGQRLYYDALTNDTSKSFPVRLIDPTGDIVFLNQQHYADSNTPFTLTEAGTYQLLVESTANFSLDSGAYSFQLLDVAAATALNFDTVTNGTLSPGQDTDLYRFTGTAGQRLVFDSLTPGFPSAAWRLFGPTNQSLVNQNLTTDLELNLTADGTYILAIDGASATSVNYSFNLITPTSARTGAPNVIVADRTGNTNTPIPLNIAASFAASDGNDQRSILISGVPSGALLSAGTNNNNGTWTLTPAQLTGLTITVANAANFALTVTATSAETTGDTATTTATFSVIVNVATGITVTPTSGLVTTEAGGSATFTVVLDSQPTANVTVGIASSDATEGSTNVSSLTFTPANWNVAQTVIVTGADDNIIDGTVAYSIVTAAATSSDPNYNGFNAANVSVSNTDNDTAGVTVSPTGGLFTSEGGGTAGFSVRLTSQPTANVSISIASSDSTEGSTNVSSLTFTPANWNVFQFVTVTGVDDGVVDGNIAYTILTGATTSTDANYSGLVVADVGVTNVDNDAASFSISDVSIIEGNSGTTTAVFTVTLSNAVVGGTSVSYATANGTAIAGSDYVATSGTLNFTGTAGEQRTVSVTINGDTTIEPNESFVLNLSAPTNGVTLADSQGVGTITNDDAAPLPVVTLAVAPGSVTENGATNLVYTFSRTGDTTNSLVVNYSIGGTATGGTDYGLIPAAVTFAAGSATASVTVDPTGDTQLEPNETVALTLTADPAYTIGTAGAVTGTITNDDAASFSISDVSIVEGNTGTSQAVFTVTLSNAVAGGASVSYATADFSATAGSDYIATSGTLNFTGNVGETQTVSVTINGDTTVELNENFFVNLSNPTNGVSIADGQGIGTITIDDFAPLPVITLAVSPASAPENGAGNLIYTFTRTGDTTFGLTVNFTISGTATNGTDYGLISSAAFALFTPGSATTTLTIDPTGDTVLEPDETVAVTLLANAAYTIGTAGPVTGTITNDDAASFSISDVSISEGNSGTKTAVFTVSLSQAVAGGTSVSYATANGTATAGSDYLAASGTLTFTGTAGETQTVSVTINADTTFEPDESFFLNLSAPTNGVTIADSQGLGTITNDDPAPLPVVTLAVSPASVTENGATNLIYTFTRTGATTNPLTVNYAINGTASNGTDYALIPASLTFAAGSATATVTVDPTTDAILEPDETVALTLTADPAYVVGTTTAVTGTIANDDAASLSISDVTLTEGDAGTKIAVFTVTLNQAVAGGTSVAYATANGNATAGSDYLATSGTINFAGTAGETQTISVTINGESRVELNETFFLNLSAPTNGVTLADGQGLGTITNDDAASLSINNVSRVEGNSGITSFVFDVTLNNAVDVPLSVGHATANGTATLANNDYQAANGTLNFVGTAGETQQITVNALGDTTVEANETFVVNLSNLQASGRNVTLANAQATGTITNDDGASFSINDVSVTEGNSGTKTAVFSVTLNNAVSGGSSVSYATANGTATAGSDYLAASGTLNFAGTAGETQTISVTINGDTVFEPDETFFLNLSAPTNGVTIADSQGLGTITNDDPAPLPIVTLAVTPASVTENGTTNLIYTFTRTGATTNPLTVNYAINGTATGGTDFGAIPASVVFAAGSATATLVVDPTADAILEPDETVALTLTADPAYLVGTPAAVIGTITNDDAASFSIGDVSISEGNSGTKTAVFSVTLNNAVSGGSSVSYATANGTATAGSDYLAAAGILTFTGTAGETQTVSVTINGDTAFEPDETFFLNLSAPTNGVTIADSQGLGTITNDDPAPLPIVTLAVTPASVTENGTTNLIYTFTRTGATTNPLTVNYAINGTATGGTDFGAIPASVVFAAGSATATLVVDPTADAILEPDETVVLTLTADPAYLVGTPAAVIGTITNDDAASFSIGDVSISEGNSGTKTAVFSVTLNNAVSGGAAVSYATANGTATAGSDYLAAAGILTFTGTAGETQTVSVTINGDTAFEPDETFFLNLSAPTNGVTIADSQGLGTIANDDGRAITGTRNRETLTGTAGDDVITGLQGADTVRGNGGADRFVYTSIVDAGDTIIDFNRAEGDKVDLKGALASVGYTGTTPITDGYLKFVARGSDTLLQIDPDGSGLAAARSFILFKNVDLATLSNPDNFIV